MYVIRGSPDCISSHNMTMIRLPFFPSLFLLFIYTRIAPQTRLSTLSPHFQTVYFVPPSPSPNNKLRYHRSSLLCRRQT